MMRKIEYEKIIKAVEDLCVQAAFNLPPDVLQALQDASDKNSASTASTILKQLVENANIARDESIPLCQDTGLAVVFVKLGSQVLIDCPPEKTLTDAINQGIENGYEKAYLRKSVVAEPLNTRTNTKTNTPAIIHYEMTLGSKIEIALMAKGGGCENKSMFKMFNPTADKNQIVDWLTDVVKNAGASACPPFVIGVGLGGNFETSALLSKKALLRNINHHNSDHFYAELEKQMLSAVNALNLGPQGLGGQPTALACLVETAPCHIASLPAAINIECHSHRHKSVTL